ncbi:MAG: hypothetical protein KTR31_41045 [Myxococcales bacterium]|nr:hypothetical protein [Myxococcales bacterium]
MTSWLLAAWLGTQPSVAAPLTSAVRTPVQPVRMRWHTLRTRFFRVHHPVSGPRRHPTSAERTAREVARIADQLLLDLAQEMDFDARAPIHVVVTDHADDITAYSQPQWRWIVLSADPGHTLFRLRGQTDWVRDTLAHELAHIVSHRRAASVAPVSSYGLRLGGLWEHPQGGIGVGATLAPNEPHGPSEGLAELLSADVGVNHWTANRDVTVRGAALDGRWLTLDEWLSDEALDPHDAERSYQLGYAFGQWLREHTGRRVLADAFRSARDRYPWSWKRRLTKAAGADIEELWRAFWVQSTVRATLRATQPDLVEGEPLTASGAPAPDLSVEAWRGLPTRAREQAHEAQGTWVLFPTISPDEVWTAQTHVDWIQVTSRDTTHWFPATFGSAPAFVPGDQSLVVAAPVDTRSLLPAALDRTQLYRVDLAVGPGHPAPGARRRMQPIRGTTRGRDPAVSPDGTKLAWVHRADGTSTLMVADLDGSDSRSLTEFSDGSTLQRPAWSPDGTRIAVSLHRTDQANLWVVDVATGALTPLTYDGWEATDPWWDAAGIWFVSNVDGQPDVFLLNPDSARVLRITRGVGGAATPSTSGSRVLYARRSGHGWTARELSRADAAGEDVSAAFQRDVSAEQIARDLAFLPAAPQTPSKRYRPWSSVLPVALGPLLRVDLPGGRPVVLGGAHLRVRDALEQVELATFGVVGEDLAGRAELAWRGMGPEVAGFVEASSDRRLIHAEPTSLAFRRTVTAAGGRVTLRRTSQLAVHASAERIALNLGPVGDVQPGLRSLRGSLQLDLGELPDDAKRGVQASLTATRARSESLAPAQSPTDGDVDGPVGYTRLTGSLNTVFPTPLQLAPLRSHRHRVEASAHVGLVSRDVAAEEELRLGGDSAGAFRLATVEPSLPLPGFGPQSVSGEVVALAHGGWIVPLAPRIRSRTGPLHISGLEGGVGADLAWVGAWDGSVLRGTAPGGGLLGDLTAEVRVRASLWDRPWNSVVRVAYGFGDPTPGDPTGPTPEPFRSPDPIRFTVGVGTGW